MEGNIKVLVKLGINLGPKVYKDGLYQVVTSEINFYVRTVSFSEKVVF